MSTNGRILNNFGAGESARKNDNGDDKAVWEETRNEETKSKIKKRPEMVLSTFKGPALEYFRF